MAGSWDFTADSDIQTELSNKLNEAAANYDTKVEAMYSEIDSLGSNNYWVGEDYDAFKTGTEGYKQALQDLSNGIRMYGTHFENMAAGTDTLASELIAIVQNMTGTGGTGSSGSGASSSGTTSGDTSSGGTTSDGSTSGDTSSDGTASGGTTSGDTSSGGTTSGGTTSGDTSSGGTTSDGSTSGDTSSDGTGNVNAIVGGDEGDESGQVTGEQQSKLDEVGSRYVADWNNFTTSVSNDWSNVDGLISGAGAILATGVDTIEGVGDVAFDTIHAVDTGLESGINWVFDCGTSRDYNFIDDITENWDYSTCDNAGEYIGTTVVAIGASALDTVQGACNLATNLIDGIGDAAKGVWDFIF